MWHENKAILVACHLANPVVFGMTILNVSFYDHMMHSANQNSVQELFLNRAQFFIMTYI